MSAFIAFPLNSELEHKLKEACRRVRREPPEIQHLPFVIDLICELVDVGMNFYFAGLIQRLKLGGWGITIINMALKTAKGGLHVMIRKILKNMTNEQLHPLMGLLEEMLLEHDGKASLGFPIEGELAERLKENVRRIQNESPPSQHSEYTLTVMYALTDTGLDFYFLEAARRLQVGQWGMKTVNWGVVIARKAIHGAMKKLLPTLNDEQLATLSGFVDEIMIEIAG
ncbi:MAG: hypothetical protein HQM12_06260 [SAR324 cluster bacterium]|nr:hypothetical protein [SAR324 cluster bacterium]MBF0351671.1 hypothetical protein [SAR324 cluster bacterium]